MIFASVGTMLPFNRLVQGVDEWAKANATENIFIQIGDSSYEPRNVPWTRIMSQQEYLRKLRESKLFIAHAGVGSILQGLEMQKQMLLLPRRANLREHTTDHQIHTAKRFEAYKGIRIVNDVEALKLSISELLDTPLESAGYHSSAASDQMIQAVRQYLTDEA